MRFKVLRETKEKTGRALAPHEKCYAEHGKYYINFNSLEELIRFTETLSGQVKIINEDGQELTILICDINYN